MDEAVRVIQLKCLEILDVMDQICKSHDIQYSLCGGSVVGAHLYKGCLPWDDDIDVMMTRENYNRFIKFAPSMLPNGFTMYNYQLGDDFTKTFTKIINDNTTLVQMDGAVTGIFLDITVYDKVPANGLRKIDFALYNLSLMVMRGKMPGNSLKNRIRSFLLDTVLSSRRRYLIFFQWVVEFLGKYAHHYNYCELFGAWANTIAYRPAVFENYTTIEFEGKQYMIVRDYVEYLQTRYNRTDFREPKERQVAPHYKMVDFNLPYKEYLKKSIPD